MQLRHFLTATAATLIGVLVAGVVDGQDFPSKPFRIVTGGVGGGSDFASRLLAVGLTASMGQQVVVDNRGGASGAIAAQAVSKASPDGYTMLFYSSSFWIFPLMQDVPWDPIRDFSPLTLAARAANLLLVHPSMQVKSVQELIALAKAKPGQLNYGSGVIGSSDHIAAELFKAMAGIDIVHVPYKGAGPAINDLIGGHLQLMFATAGSVMPQVKAGRLKALAVSTAQPSALVPGLPTVAASGLPGFESAATYAMFAPVKTPPAIITQLNREIVRVLNKEDIKEKIFASGVEVVGSSPEELITEMKAEMARLGKVIKRAGVRAH